MTYSFKNISEDKFSINGRTLFKTFIPVYLSENTISILNIYDSKCPLIPPTKVSEISVNETIYPDSTALINVIHAVLFSKNTSTGSEQQIAANTLAISQLQTEMGEYNNILSYFYTKEDINEIVNQIEGLDFNLHSGEIDNNTLIFKDVDGNNVFSVDISAISQQGTLLEDLGNGQIALKNKAGKTISTAKIKAKEVYYDLFTFYDNIENDLNDFIPTQKFSLLKTLEGKYFFAQRVDVKSLANSRILINDLDLFADLGELDIEGDGFHAWEITDVPENNFIFNSQYRFNVWPTQAEFKKDLPKDFFISTTIGGSHLTYKTNEYKELDLHDCVDSIVISNSNEIERNGNDLFVTVNFTFDGSVNMHLICLYDCYIDENENLQVSRCETLELSVATVHSLLYHRGFLYLITRTRPSVITKVNPYNLTDFRQVTIQFPGPVGDFIPYNDKLYIPICEYDGWDLSILEIDVDLQNQSELVVIPSETGYKTSITLPIEIYNNEIYIAFFGSGTEFGIKVYDLAGNLLRKNIVETSATPQIAYPPLPHWMTIFGGKLLITTVYTSALVRVNPYTLQLEESLPLNTSIITDDNSVFSDGYIYLNSEYNSAIPVATDVFLWKVNYRDFTDVTVEIDDYNGNVGSWGSLNPVTYKEGNIFPTRGGSDLELGINADNAYFGDKGNEAYTNVKDVMDYNLSQHAIDNLDF